MKKNRLKLIVFYLIVFLLITYFTGFRVGTLLPFILGLVVMFFFTDNKSSTKSDDFPTKDSFIKPEKLDYDEKI